MTHKPTQISDLRATLESMTTPGQAAAMVDLVPDLVRGLPPDRAELASREKFELGSDTVLLAQFENLRVATGNAVSNPEVIEVPYDMWIRGAVGWAMNQLPGEGGELLADAGSVLGARTGRAGVFNQYGDAGRCLFEVNWRLNGRQGFVQRGAGGETLAKGTTVLGTGRQAAPMDWQLQNGQTIEVRVRNITDQLLAIADDSDKEIRLLVVAFYGLRQPLGAATPSQYGA